MILYEMKRSLAKLMVCDWSKCSANCRTMMIENVHPLLLGERKITPGFHVKTDGMRHAIAFIKEHSKEYKKQYVRKSKHSHRKISKR